MALLLNTIRIINNLNSFIYLLIDNINKKNIKTTFRVLKRAVLDHTYLLNCKTINAWIFLTFLTMIRFTIYIEKLLLKAKIFVLLLTLFIYLILKKKYNMGDNSEF